MGVPSRVVEAADASGFSGIAASDGESPGDRWMLVRGLADRAHSVPVALGTRFGIASGSKAFTALTVIALVSDGRLSLDTPAREVLGSDLPLIDDAVTVEHLLAHRCGIGDYLDEDAVGAITDYVMSVPVHRLESTEDYIAVLDGHSQMLTPGERFAYNNGGYVVLALLAQRVSGVVFHEMVRQRRPRSESPSDQMHYGLGFWLTLDGAVELEGYDASVSFRQYARSRASPHTHGREQLERRRMADL
jgi:CubicO group peptidase (beta-lactamase class C family)